MTLHFGAGILHDGLVLFNRGGGFLALLGACTIDHLAQLRLALANNRLRRKHLGVQICIHEDGYDLTLGYGVALFDKDLL